MEALRRGAHIPASLAHRLLAAPDFGWLTMIALIAAGLRVGWIAYVNVDPLDGRFDDSVFYYAAARFLASGDGYRVYYYETYTAAWPPGYPLFIAVPFVVFGQTLLAAKLPNVAFAVVSCLLTYAVGARVFGRRCGLLAALVLALFPGQIYFSTLVMTETLFGTVFILTTLLLVWTIERTEASRGQLLALGMLVGFAVLVRVEAMALVPAILLLWRFVLPHWRQALRYGVVFVAGAALLPAAWTVRNYVRLGEFVPIREVAPGTAAYIFVPDYFERDRLFNPQHPRLSETLRPMLRHPWEMVPIQIEKLHQLYDDDSDGVWWVQNNRPLLDAGEADRWSKLASYFFFSVAACAVPAMVYGLSRRDRRRFALAYLVLVWTLVLTVPWPESRYHFPVVPILCVFAAATLIALWDEIPARLRKRAEQGTAARRAIPGEASSQEA